MRAIPNNRAAATFAASQWGPLLAQPPLAAPPAPLSGRRLRIGYLSSDFRAHAVSFLVLDAIAAHDRDTCEVVLYAHGAPVADGWRARAKAAADRFVDLEADDRSAAQRIADDRLDVLVDLNGYTAHGRMAVVARRPAPVVASWLGYIGTLGDPRLADYVIGDAVATPEAMAEDFGEALALLPHCFQANPGARRMPVASRDRPSRGNQVVARPVAHRAAMSQGSQRAVPRQVRPPLTSNHLTYSRIGRPRQEKATSQRVSCPSTGSHGSG